MCRESILVAFCVLLLGASGSAFAGFDPNLVAYWPLDEGAGTIANDMSGNNNNGTLVGALTWVTPGQIGTGALQFPGSNSVYVSAPHIAFDKRTFTIAMWIKPVLGSSAMIFGQQSSGATGLSLHLRIGGPSSSDAPVNGFLFGFYGDDLSSPPNVLTTNTWAHLTFRYDYASGARKIYVNGVQVAENTSTGYLGTSGTTYLGHWDSSSQPYTGVMDDVQIYHKALSDTEIQRIMEGLMDTSVASGPVPEDRAADVVRDVALGWMAGEYAKTHDVYLGTDFDDVNNASASNPGNVLVSQGQTDIQYAPDEPLEYGQVYYWRIDEVNGAPDYAVSKGPIWSFTAEAYGYPITSLTVTASGQESTSPAIRTIDGSGLTDDMHSIEMKDAWVVKSVPAWIQYTFDKEYVLHELWVWNANSQIEGWMGFGAKGVTVEYSTDGETWTPLENVPEFARETGVTPCSANTTVSFGEVSAKYVKLTINTVWGSGLGASLSEVRFFYAPVQAFKPDPTDGATGVSIDAELTWRPGREATSHQVYFGTDANAVAQGTAAAETVTGHAYTPDAVDFGTTYYWKVNEVGDDGAYEGEVWSFTSQEFLSIDDFESYNDDDNRIFDVWLDGYLDQSSGSQVGYIDSVNGTFGETSMIHSGVQSMPLFYNNTNSPYYSEATRTFSPAEDWTARGIKSLTVYFAGTAGNSGQLYVKINSTKVAYDGDAADLTKSVWQPWNIDLSKVSNANSVRSLTIGIEDSGATGTLYIDDIRLYPKAPELITPAEPGSAGLAAHYSLDDDGSDSSGNGQGGTVEGNVQWVQGMLNGAMQFNGANTRVVAPHIPLDSRSFTVAMWVNPVLAVAEQVVFSQTQTSGTNTDMHFRLGGLGVASGNVPVGGVRMAFYANDLDTAGGLIQDNNWYHITFWYDFENQDRRIFIDGVQAAQASATPYLGTAGDTIIGAWGTGQWFTGMIDDVQIYQRALSAEEIAWLAGRRVPIHKPM